MKNIKFQRHLKDNTELELPSKRRGWEMFFSGKQRAVVFESTLVIAVSLVIV